jgi:glycosyltransferase involved in cell wall biosynthesis
MSTTLRIVHVGLYDPQALNGVSATIVGQCEGLAAHGTNLEIWTFHPGITQVTESKTESGIPIFSLPRYGNLFLAALKAPRRTTEWIRARLPVIQLFHLHSVFSPHNNFLANLGTPYVITPNGGWSDSVIHGRRGTLKKIWISLFESKLWKNARFVQAVSHVEANQLCRLKKIADVIHLPNGVFLNDENQSSPFDKRDIWLFLGRLALEQKGLDMLLDAYAEFTRLSKDAPKLVLAGPDFRGDRLLLQQQAERLGIAGKIEFTGPLRGVEKERIWEQTELFLHPSRWEGMPLAILEALGHGIPCLVSPQTGLGDWIEKNEAGWMVELNIDELARAFERINRERQTLPVRGKNALIGVQRDYSWNSITKNLLSQYQRIL